MVETIKTSYGVLVLVVYLVLDYQVQRFCCSSCCYRNGKHLQSYQVLRTIYVDGSFCSIFFQSVLTCNSCCSIMHALPLPPCGLYSTRAQNGDGQHRPCKIVLLTLVTPRGGTDLYLSWGVSIEHARTAYRETCGTEYQQPYRRRNSQTPYNKRNVAQARTMSVSYVPRNLQSRVSTTHRSYSQLTFSIFLRRSMKKVVWYKVPLRRCCYS